MVKKKGVLMPENNLFFAFDPNKPILECLKPIVKKKGIWVIKERKHNDETHL